MQSGFKGGRHEGGSSNGSNKDVTLFKSLFDFFGSALLTRCVCIFPFHASHGQTDWHESQARLVISLFEFDCLFPLSGGKSDHDPCGSVSHCIAPPGEQSVFITQAFHLLLSLCFNIYS